MVWTAGFTFVASTPLTASQLNTYLTANTNFLLNGKALVTKRYLGGTTDYTLTTSQASWIAVDGTNLIVTSASSLASGRFQILVSFGALITNAGTAANLSFDILVDSGTSNYYLSQAMANNGVATAGTPTIATGGTVNFYADSTFSNSVFFSLATLQGVVSGLSTGATHTFTLVYSSSHTGGTPTMTLWNKNIPVVITVIEL